MTKGTGQHNKDVKEISLGEEEQQAIRKLDPDLEEHSALMQAAVDFLQDLLGLVPEMNMEDMPQSLKVTVGLLARLWNDLRCIALLAHRGYAVQACALAASTYEVAFCLLFISSDDGVAQEWIDHKEPTRSFRNVWEMTLEGLRKLDIADAQAPVEYRVYSQLCMPRHANPLFQMEHSFRPTQDGTVSPLIGPDTSREAIRTAQYSMEHVSALAFLAGTSFAKNHLEPRLPAEVVSQLIKKLRTIGSTMTTLKEKAKARWGTEDPFPGKWRQMGMKGGSSMPTVTITPELHSRLVQFKQVLEAILQQTISFDECIDVTLRLGIHDLLDEILGALPPEALLHSVKEIADRYPTEIYGYLAENLKRGPMEVERQRLSRQIGFRPERGGALEKKDGPAPETGKQGA